MPIFDANALLVMGCDWLKRDREQDLVTGMALTGRGTPHLAGHIPEELERHVGRLAGENEVPEAQVRRVLDDVILPSARLVDLEIRDLLSPGARGIRQVDPALPRRLRGDPDDAPTMALAEFLAPSVIISQDSVFYRFGFATAAAEWIPIAKPSSRCASWSEPGKRLLAGWLGTRGGRQPRSPPRCGSATNGAT
ncbi:hypothetical protein AB0D10_25325 [Kitasatospora sp. NPDC048545]|uniref:hypothetical protein n=1 Tax=Kitasatospora sp. NPDC048545 TaxID=3157208 RepID=UPI0033F2D18E